MLTVNNSPRQQSRYLQQKRHHSEKKLLLLLLQTWMKQGNVIVRENTSRWFQFPVSLLSFRPFCGAVVPSLLFLLRQLPYQPLLGPSLHSSSCSHTCVSNSALDPHSEPTEDGLPPAPRFYFLTRQFRSRSLSSYLFSLFSGHDRQSALYSRQSCRGF